MINLLNIKEVLKRPMITPRNQNVPSPPDRPAGRRGGRPAGRGSCRPGALSVPLSSAQSLLSQPPSAQSSPPPRPPGDPLPALPPCHSGEEVHAWLPVPDVRAH